MMDCKYAFIIKLSDIVMQRKCKRSQQHFQYFMSSVKWQGTAVMSKINYTQYTNTVDTVQYTSGALNFLRSKLEVM
jgi:hypothetical protein